MVNSQRLKSFSSLNFFDFCFHFGRFHVVDFAVEDDAYAAGFFGDDQNDAVVSLGNTNAGAVSETVAARKSRLLRDRKDAACRHDFVVRDDHCAVVERAVFEEDIFKQRLADYCVNDNACIDNVL